MSDESANSAQVAPVPARRLISLSDALLVAAATAAGYHFAYLYEFGFCRYFGIPTGMIRIEVSDVVGTTVGSLLALSYVFSTVGPLLGETARRWLRITLDRQWGFIWVSAGMVVWSPGTIVAMFYANVGVVLISAVVDMVRFRIGPRELWRRRRKADAEHEPHPSSTIGAMYQLYGRRVTRLLSLFLLASVVMYFVGHLSARLQESFLVVPGNPPRVVLRFYGGHAVTAVAQLERQKITHRFSVVPVESLLNVEYRHLRHLSPQSFPRIIPPHLRSSSLKKE